MQFRNHFEQITEGVKEIKDILTKKGLESSIINKLVSFDSTPSKRDALRLGQYYLEMNGLVDVETIRDYYTKFNKIKAKKSGIDINSFKKWHDFENFVDASETRMELNRKTVIDKTKGIENEAIFNKNGIQIYLARTATDAIRYSHGLGQDYDFCIGRKGSGNAFAGYRMRLESAFYFVLNTNKSNKIKNGKFEDPSHMIVIDHNDRGFMWTWADNGTQGHPTESVTSARIASELSEFMTSEECRLVFVRIPLTEEEKNKISKFQNLSALIQGRLPDCRKVFAKFTYGEKKEYIQCGYTLPLKGGLDLLDNALLNEYAGIGHMMTLHEVETAFPMSIRKRWGEIRMVYYEHGRSPIHEYDYNRRDGFFNADIKYIFGGHPERQDRIPDYIIRGNDDILKRSIFYFILKSAITTQTEIKKEVWESISENVINKHCIINYGKMYNNETQRDIALNWIHLPYLIYNKRVATTLASIFCQISDEKEKQLIEKSLLQFLEQESNKFDKLSDKLTTYWNSQNEQWPLAFWYVYLLWKGCGIPTNKLADTSLGKINEMDTEVRQYLVNKLVAYGITSDQILSAWDHWNTKPVDLIMDMINEEFAIPDIHTRNIQKNVIDELKKHKLLARFIKYMKKRYPHLKAIHQYETSEDGEKTTHYSMVHKYD